MEEGELEGEQVQWGQWRMMMRRRKRRRGMVAHG